LQAAKPAAVHRFPSPHAAPAGALDVTQPATGSHDPITQGFDDVQFGTIPGWHAEAPSHVAVPAAVHRSPSPHGLPAGAGDVTQPTKGSHAAIAHGLVEVHVTGIPG
jgi:hypothetical protein